MYKYLIISIIILSFIAIFIPGVGPSDLIITLLSVTTFLFGIFLAFTIANRQSRFGSIRTALRKDDALLLSIYKLSASFGPKVQNKCRILIDDFLIASIDYKLVDYTKSIAKFNKLFDLFNKIEPETKSQEAIYENIISALKESTGNKKELIHRLNEKMLAVEWGSLLILTAIILMSLFIINNNSIASIIIIVLLGTSMVLFLLILKSLDSLRWKEGSWIWDPLVSLFVELELSPYIPKYIIGRGVKLQKGITYRVTEYVHPYPDFSDKEIEIFEN
ncbi:hypothetical protein ACFL11_00870 [Patescibacteria group bacterium]